MGRLHLIEFEDQPWFPPVIRICMQDYLRFMADWSGSAYQGFATKLKAAMERLGQRDILDLGSGGGGPVKIILRMLQAQGFVATARLTDLYPNLAAYEQLARESNGTIRGYESSVNATNVPVELGGFRLVANAFHHLHPQEAEAVLADAVAKHQGIAIIEMVGRSVFAFLSIFISLAILFVATPFVRPFRLVRLVFTYLIPLIPLALAWDGMVSCLRVYSPDELRTLVSQLDTTEYEWDIGTIRFGPGIATYLIGTPRI